MKIGTPYYASPEVWKDQPYDQKSDICTPSTAFSVLIPLRLGSLGCVIYEAATLKPPFRAEDMEGLYKKVIRGYYQKLPANYSMDLNNIIRLLLQVSPHMRPNCDKLLQLPSVIKRMEDQVLNVVQDDATKDLMKTIYWPRHPHYLTERLPKANYEPLQLKKVDKQRFLQTLAGSMPARENLHQMSEFGVNKSVGMAGVHASQTHSEDPPSLPMLRMDNSKDRMKRSPASHSRDSKNEVRIGREGSHSRDLSKEGAALFNAKSTPSYTGRPPVPVSRSIGHDDPKTHQRDSSKGHEGVQRSVPSDQIINLNKVRAKYLGEASLGTNSSIKTSGDNSMRPSLNIQQIYGLKTKKYLPSLHKENNIGPVQLSEGSQLKKVSQQLISLGELIDVQQAKRGRDSRPKPLTKLSQLPKIDMNS